MQSGLCHAIDQRAGRPGRPGATLLLPALAACAALAAAGCAPSNQAISTETAAPLKAEWSEAGAHLAAGRYLLLPVQAERKGPEAAFWSGSYAFSSASWVGLTPGGGYRHLWLNLHVIDLSDGRHMTVFDRQVAMGDWHGSFDERGQFHFPPLLIFLARDEDTSGDSQIDEQDEVRAMAFDCAAGRRRTLSPQGHSVVDMTFRPHDVVLLLKTGDGGLAVYVCDPQTGTGRFVAEGLRP